MVVFSLAFFVNQIEGNVLFPKDFTVISLPFNSISCLEIISMIKGFCSFSMCECFH